MHLHTMIIHESMWFIHCLNRYGTSGGLYEETYAQHSMCERSTYQGIFMPPYTAVQVRKIAVEYKEKANKSLPTFILK